MKFKPIHSEDDYDKAVEQIAKLMSAEAGTQEASDLEVLAVLVEAYERKNYPMRGSDPIEMLAYAFDQQKTSWEQKARIFGGDSRASEIMNRKRKLTLAMIRRAHEELAIPLELLVKDYVCGGAAP